MFPLKPFAIRHNTVVIDGTLLRRREKRKLEIHSKHHYINEYLHGRYLLIIEQAPVVECTARCGGTECESNMPRSRGTR